MEDNTVDITRAVNPDMNVVHGFYSMLNSSITL